MAHSIAEHSKLVPVSVVLLAALGAAGSSAIAVADPLPYGPDTCIQGYVWREAQPSDHVCVTPPIRDATAAQNAAAAQKVEPGGGASGPATCKQNFVWRNAYDGDVVCVTVGVRDQAAQDNAAAQSRYQRNQPNAQPAPPPADKGAPPPPPDWAGGGGGGGNAGVDPDPGNYNGACSPRGEGTKFDTDICMLAPPP
jgi:hypothetical protein